MEKAERPVAPWARVAILVATLLGGCALSYYLTGSVVPTAAADALIFQSTMLFVVLGSAVLEHKFTRPADSVVNALMGMISLVTVYGIAPRVPWWTVFGYCLAVFVVSLTCTVVSVGPGLTGWREQVARWTYQPSVVFGKARLLYSLVFLFAVFAFYGVQAPRTAVLVGFWGLFMALWPLGVPQLLTSLSRRQPSVASIGHVVRLDSPNLLRIQLDPTQPWERSTCVLYQGPDGVQHAVLPLYAQVREGATLATGLIVRPVHPPVPSLAAGCVYQMTGTNRLSEAEAIREFGGREGSSFVGFVIEESAIGAIRFETWREDRCREGLLVWCMVGDCKVFYQVTAGLTREEALQADRHGFQYAIAAQIGAIGSDSGFSKHAWLPAMNAPVFCEDEAFGSDIAPKAGDFIYGRIPGTEIRVGGPFFDVLDHHTAILGVTGSGKTELAFDLIRHVLTKQAKVVCIDLTARYEHRLGDLAYRDLSISGELSASLGEKLFDAETGAYGAGQEKKALKQFADQLRSEVSERLAAFLTSTDASDRLGIISLDEISNTKATLFITELYLTCLLRYARDNREQCPKILIVVEEAHTVVPEPTTVGLGDFDSRGLVSKISQIALQGRKYGVGLLVIAQRTATVSKSVLTQCNTTIAFGCFDETSLGFLSNVLGDTHARLIPNLPRLHAVVFGMGVRSERPVIVEIPFDAGKADA